MLDETTCRLALQYQPNYGNVLIKKLIQHYGSASEIFSRYEKRGVKIRGLSTTLSKPQLTKEILIRVEEELELIRKHGIKLCFFTDELFPQRVKNCHDAPFLFFYKGKPDFNHTKTIAIVGTRNMSSYGKECVKRIISGLAGYNVSIISGLAQGIDTAAHEQALEQGLHTAAVMGSGFCTTYPASNGKLAEKIVANGGTLISEYPFFTKPDKQNFPKRNRIIAGMADATIVMETAKKGGSIITAGIAQSYNRDVFAVPGSIFSKSYEGCHELIRSNMAALVHSGENIAEMMGWDSDSPKYVQRELFVELSDDEKLLAERIRQNSEIQIDSIIQQCPELSPSKVVATLLSLEFKGVIQCKPGKTYSIL